MAQVETLGIVPESKAVFELIMRYLTALVESKSPPPPHHHLHEFDDCQYLVHGDSAGGLRLSFALPCLEDCFREQLLTENTLELIQGAYQGMATVLQPPEPGYQVSLQLEVRVLTRISPADRAYWVRLMASIRQLVTGQPLRSGRMAGRGEARRGRGVVRAEEYFVKPHAQSVTVILPVRFLTVQDAAIGHAVLQEFADARRQASLGNAPSCAYFPAKVSGNFIIADSGVGRLAHGLLGLDPSVCHAPAEWSLTWLPTMQPKICYASLTNTMKCSIKGHSIVKMRLSRSVGRADLASSLASGCCLPATPPRRLARLLLPRLVCDTSSSANSSNANTSSDSNSNGDNSSNEDGRANNEGWVVGPTKSAVGVIGRAGAAAGVAGCTRSAARVAGEAGAAAREAGRTKSATGVLALAKAAAWVTARARRFECSKEDAEICRHCKQPQEHHDFMGEVPAALLDGVSGFMSFTVTERHVRAAHIEEVVWSLHTFRILIGFHITSCKTGRPDLSPAQVDAVVAEINKRMTMGSKQCVLTACLCLPMLLHSFLGQPSQGFLAVGPAPGPPPPT
ncbi:hypothetical protein QJQ45_012127 [Haematococcus lacustris]|nr:hypothetical protein QJQ45_012127 [Haematococcus lacustris]